MRTPRLHPRTVTPPSPSTNVPDSQARALDRRQALAEQQRAFQGPNEPRHKVRSRPPA